ncbi:MAG: aminodeoxychorismate/anthranilate synthase component II [Desulfosudaceae bacterium]
MKKLIIIDNYDSFTYNLVQLFLLFDLDIKVFRHDRIDLAGIEATRPDYIVISPGPRTPARSGISIPVIKALGPDIPILGVCLGMQCVNEAFGGVTTRAPLPVHGKTDAVYHTGQNLFCGLPSPFRAARYHSLIICPENDRLAISAWTADDIIMGLWHRDYPIYGVQFHPESFLTDHGRQLAENFLCLKRPGK